MFPTRFFPDRYFAPRYFPKVGANFTPGSRPGSAALGIRPIETAAPTVQQVETSVAGHQARSTVVKQ